MEYRKFQSKHSLNKSCILCGYFILFFFDIGIPKKKLNFIKKLD